MKKIALISTFSIVCMVLFAQSSDTADLPQSRVKGVMWLGPNPNEPQVDLKPKFRGTLRTRYEYDFNENLNRFAVRNARAAVSGNANHWISYLMQVDLSDNGVFRILDAEIQMKPVENLTLIVGQTFVPFIQKHLLTPGQALFTNRAMVNKYMSGAPRDIGVYANYCFLFDEIFPINLSAAVFNGSGTNNPRWTEPIDLGYAAQLMFGSMDNFQLALKTYRARNDYGTEIQGVDLRYFNKDWSDGFTFEAEVVIGTLNYKHVWRYGYYFQAGNMFRTGNYAVKYIEPIARWDVMGFRRFFEVSDANRLTLGMNFGFDPTYRKTELRLNYEKYFVDKDYTEFYFGSDNTSWHDKIVLELLINF
jgi:hypothetical protein